mgnify:CR=1 FL=1
MASLIDALSKLNVSSGSVKVSKGKEEEKKRNVITLRIDKGFLEYLDKIEKGKDLKKMLVNNNPDSCLPCVIDPNMEEMVKILSDGDSVKRKKAIRLLNEAWIYERPVDDLVKDLVKEFGVEKVMKLREWASKFRMVGVSSVQKQ